MKLSEETLEIISSIRTLNAGVTVQGAVFKKGSIIKARRSKAEAPILYATITEEFPVDFAVSDLKKFLSMWMILDDPEIDWDDEYIYFKSGKKKAKMKNARPDLLEKPEFFDREIRMPPADFTFDLSVENLKGIKNAASTFSAPELALIGNGSKVTLSTYNSNNPRSDNFEIEVGEHTSKFTAIIDIQYVQFLMRSYNVTLSFKGILEFKSPNLVYYITTSTKSKWNK